MPKKHAPDALVDGMFMGGAILRFLTDAVVAKGGYPEMVHYLTTERGRAAVDKMADVVVANPWRIPRSLMERLAHEAVLSDSHDGDDAERGRYHEWTVLELDLDVRDGGWGLPVSKYRGHAPDDPCDLCDGDYLLIDDELYDQLRGKRLPRAVITVTMHNEDYVVVYLETVAKQKVGVLGERQFGDVIFFRNEELTHIFLVPVDCFDMNR